MKILFFVFLLYYYATTTTTTATMTNPTRWQTLTGNPPIIIARGGYSGNFPESSDMAYHYALSTSLPDVVLFCDLQLTKDGAGICLSNLQIDLSTNIASIHPEGNRVYNVNGRQVHGWFAMDYTILDLLLNVTMIQDSPTRTIVFDGVTHLMLVQQVLILKPSAFWLNVQYPTFLSQHKQDPIKYITELIKTDRIDYISSPEIGFLKSIRSKVKKEKLVFHFLDKDVVEPTTNRTYGSFLDNLSTVKSFASGILVPKTYIWPVDVQNYLLPHTRLVEDAHEEGLEVYASGFANDLPESYNYSYSPTAEYLQYIDNKEFTVDGLLTDFPSTASESIACFAHNKKSSDFDKGKFLVISHGGASGVYAASSDLAYRQAIDDGADVIDCSVQMSKDGVPFCSLFPDLTASTTAITNFVNLSSRVPEIGNYSAIYSFDLTWNEIKTLKPAIITSYAQVGLDRNPAARNAGKLMALSEFLDFAKENAVPGVLLHIKNAAYLASKRGLGVVQATTAALKKAGYDKQDTPTVYIQCNETSLLSKFPMYKRILLIDDAISGVPRPVANEIKKYADAVRIQTPSLFPIRKGFITQATSVVEDMHAVNISVFYATQVNEFVLMAYDFLSDPMVEIATYASIGLDGIVTEFPATVATYLRSRCYKPHSNTTSYTILPAKPGALLKLVRAGRKSLAPPAPSLKDSDFTGPPLPPVLRAYRGALAPGPISAENGQSKTAVSAALCLALGVMCLISSYSLLQQS